MRIFRKQRQPRANTRALASFAGRLVEVVLTIIDLVVEGAPETDDAARGSQQQERAARTGQRIGGAHLISRGPEGAVLATATRGARAMSTLQSESRERTLPSLLRLLDVRANANQASTSGCESIRIVALCELRGSAALPKLLSTCIGRGDALRVELSLQKPSVCPTQRRQQLGSTSSNAETADSRLHTALGDEDLVQAPLPRCAVFVDRHVYKNGGSTMREIMLENSMRDGWAYSGCGPQRIEPI